MEPSDHNLLVAMERGEESAFETLFLRYRQTVFAILIRLVGNAEEADDLTQEVFLRLYRLAPRARGEIVNLPAWLYRVATNLGYNALRDRRRFDQREQRARVLNNEPPDGDPIEDILRAERRGDVQQVLAEMAYREQALLILRYSGLSYAEIAAVLEIAPGSIGTLLARAEQKFKKLYTGNMQAPATGHAPA